jgi:hydroxyethylthiazole kinase-like uncharacterized protein yjeF
MNPLYSVAQVREIERQAAAQLPEGTLMQRAGRAAANAALDLLPGLRSAATPHARVLVLAGPGNNGGDAFEVAAHLAHAGAQITVLHIAGSGSTATERDQALARTQESAARFITLPAGDIGAMGWDLVVDGLFGIGLQRPVSGAAADLVKAANTLDCPVLALDVPSGLDADTGRVVGPDGCAIRATHTITFIGAKAGLHTAEGRDHAGTISVDRLDIDEALFPPAAAQLNDPALFAGYARPRRHASHKGSHGSVAVLGGAPGMAGAPVLAGRAALHAGAGRVFLCYAGEPLALDAGQPEVMCRAAAGFDFGSAVTVAGPGLGSAAEAARLLAAAIDSSQPLVLDADALNLIATDPALRLAVASRTGATVATPHPLEAARLLDTDVGAVQRDRLSAARSLATGLQAVVVLKGSGSVIAAPDGRLVINPTGNPGLATAGTGDVLAGLAGALMAQGWPAWEGTLAAVWLHGAAADALVANGIGPIGLTAGELVPAIRAALNRLVAQHAPGKVS